MASIYVITNDINGKQYVGKTNDTIQNRFEQHVKDSERRRCEKRPLYSAMNKYGIEHFSIEELEECSPKEAPLRETYWIDKLNTYHYGYNATRGGDGKQLYDYKQISYKYLELQNQRETAIFFGCDTFTVRQACKQENIPILECGKVNKNKSSKTVAMCDIVTNKIIKIFSSIKEAAVYLGDITFSAHIGRVANGKRKTAYGYKWKFIQARGVTEARDAPNIEARGRHFPGLPYINNLKRDI